VLLVNKLSESERSFCHVAGLKVGARGVDCSIHKRFDRARAAPTKRGSDCIDHRSWKNMRRSPPLGQDIYSKKRRAFRGTSLHRSSSSASAASADPTRRELKVAKILMEQREEVVRHAIATRAFETHFQPIVDLRSGQPIGAEALSRFAQLPVRAPDQWFAEAASFGLGVELELIALENALDHLHLLPPSVYLSVNASVETMLTERFQEIVADAKSERIVLELTEHTKVVDYDFLDQRIKHLRSSGVRLAVDDAGAGYSGLAHILNLQPDIIKLDISLTRGIDSDPARRALGRALLRFGIDAYNASFVAEGIETASEYETLRSLGCPLGQGFFLGRPAPLLDRPNVGTRSPLPPLVMPEPPMRRPTELVGLEESGRNPAVESVLPTLGINIDDPLDQFASSTR
jgi:EAL domain-containing protein (putative c-di-GMP-specific phosphodiesterase class I)